MKKIFGVLFLSFLFLSVSAQEHYESQFGVKYQHFKVYGNGISLPAISFIYKKQVSKNKFRRVDFGFTGSASLWHTSMLSIGNENHIQLKKRFDLIYGLKLEGQYSRAMFGRSTSRRINLGVGFLLGFEYKINKNWNIGVSFTPTILSSSHQVDGRWSNFSKAYMQPNFAIHLTRVLDFYNLCKTKRKPIF